ncbi:sodium channel protein Nach isoform X2 [Spodoptera frugiperda]|uniref:Sodium channel protein Nach isoform X2 n=1 Tax=Spodoptera frugiperda TaxID=7108 RepID=A0A9R0D4V1_SPOFR|nr:sodium channel protein Nach isoform X2 [Spodoptera frugiperda]
MHANHTRTMDTEMLICRLSVIESTQGAIWDVPFPAVTICDLNIVSKKAARNMARNLTLPENITEEYVFEAFRLVPLLYSTFSASEQEKEQLKVLQSILDLNNMPIDVLFKELSPATSCGNLVQQCMWKNSIYSCDEMFKQIYTLLSLCCTFNYFAVDNIENELKTDKRPLKTPRRVASCGYQTALTVLLYTNPDDYYSATIASQGALVIIDNAYNIPDLDSPVRMVNPSTELLIALSPERTYTTSGIRSFQPDQRQCYYSDEIKIGNFHQYSFHNCMAYKKVSMLKKHCNCIPLSFPKEESYRFCNFNDMDCVDEIFNEAEDSNLTREVESEITCYPECEHYDYPLEVALGNLAKSAYVNGLLFFDNIELKNRSLLNVFFNDLVSTRYRRDVYLNWQNILAAFGGLLSLMLGFTLISGFDLILFFTVRVAYDRYTTMTRKPQNNKIYVNDFNTRKNWMDNTIPNLVNQKPVQNINNTTKYNLNDFVNQRY